MSDKLYLTPYSQTETTATWHHCKSSQFTFCLLHWVLETKVPSSPGPGCSSRTGSMPWAARLPWQPLSLLRGESCPLQTNAVLEWAALSLRPAGHSQGLRLAGRIQAGPLHVARDGRKQGHCQGSRAWAKGESVQERLKY